MSAAILALLVYLVLAYSLGVIAQAATADPSPKVRFVRVPKDKFRLRPQTRHHSPEYLRRLADSLLLGQLQPVGMLKDGTVLFGNGRVLAALLEPKIADLWAVVLEEEISEREFLRRQAVENFVRNDLSNAEKCKICVGYANSATNMTLKEIAQDLGVDPSVVTRWMSWEKVIDPVREALAADKLTLTGMYAISQLPQAEQAAALTAALSAPNAAAVAQAVRKQRNGNGGKGDHETIKVKRIKCDVPGRKASITIAGQNISLSLAIEIVQDWLREAKKSAEQGLSAKSFERVCKDKSRGA